jgi:3-hydroxyisobutyrate dehydrogenase-like beta-hydroxyacid dehydrogenase
VPLRESASTREPAGGDLIVGFLGVGSMGAPMAANAARGEFQVRVYNRTRAKADALARRAPVEVAATPAEAADGADVVITMVSDGAAVIDLYTGHDGALSSLPSGSIALDMSTIGPDALTRVHETLAPHDIHVVDAPVSGSVATAEAADLTIMAGGATEDVERVRPVLEAIGTPVIHVGPLGTGQAMKLAVNNIIFGLAEAVAESLVLAERAGIERSSAYEVFTNSAIAAPMVHYRRGAYERPDEAPADFRLALAAKDLELITDLARRVGAPMPQAELNMDLVRRAIADGFGEQDMALVAEYLRRSAGVPDASR